MSPHHPEVEPEITLPAGMEIVVPPRAPEEIEESALARFREGDLGRAGDFAPSSTAGRPAERPAHNPTLHATGRPRRRPYDGVVPELPEVETVRRRLGPVLEGATIARVEILDSRLTRPVDPAFVADGLVGERIAAVERRGKYLLWRLDSGRTLVVHLRMTGSLRHAPAGELPEDAYRRATLELDTGAEVGYRDVRRFGTWELLDEGHLRPYLAARLGPEPLAPSFTAPASPRLSRAVGRRSRRSSSISAASPASGTSTPTRHSGGRESIPGGRQASWRRTRSCASTGRSARRSVAASSSRDRLFGTM